MDLPLWVLALIGIGVGKWFLPLVSGGRLALCDVLPKPRFRPWGRLPSGQLGIDAFFFGCMFAIAVVFATIGLLCLIPR